MKSRGLTSPNTVNTPNPAGACTLSCASPHGTGSGFNMRAAGVNSHTYRNVCALHWVLAEWVSKFYVCACGGCVSVWTFVRECAHPCMHEESGGCWWLSFSVTLHLIFGDKSFSLNSKLTSLAGLFGQGAPGICPSLPPMCCDYQHLPPHQAFCLGAGDLNRLILVW